MRRRSASAGFFAGHQRMAHRYAAAMAEAGHTARTWEAGVGWVCPVCRTVATSEGWCACRVSTVPAPPAGSGDTPG